MHFLIIGLIIIESVQDDINFVLIVSIFLVFFSIINVRNLTKKKIEIKNINLSLKILGLFHGLSCYEILFSTRVHQSFDSALRICDFGGMGETYWRTKRPK